MQFKNCILPFWIAVGNVKAVGAIRGSSAGAKTKTGVKEERKQREKRKKSFSFWSCPAALKIVIPGKTSFWI